MNHLTQLPDGAARARAITAAGNHLPDEYTAKRTAWTSASLDTQPWRRARRGRGATLVGPRAGPLPADSYG